jgi:hypothetical protein
VVIQCFTIDTGIDDDDDDDDKKQGNFVPVLN